MTNLSGVIKSMRNIMREDSGINGDAQRIEQLGWMLFLKIFDDKDQEQEILQDNYKSPIPKPFQWRNWAADDEGMTGDELQQFVDGNLFPTLKDLPATTPHAIMVREVFDGNHNFIKSGTVLRKLLNKLNEIDFNKTADRNTFGEIYETILKELQSAGSSGEFYTPRPITQFIVDMLNPQLGETLLDPACGTGGFLTCDIEKRKQQANTVDAFRKIQNNIRGWEWKPLPYLLGVTNLILHGVEVPNITHRDGFDTPLTEYKQKDRVDIIAANPPFGGVVANGYEKNFPTFKTKESADLFLILIIHLLKEGGRAGIVLPDGSLTGTGVKQRVREKLLQDCNLHTIIRLPNSVFQPYATVATNLLFFNKVEHNKEQGYATKEVWYYEHRLPEGQKAYSKTKPIQLHELDPIKKWWDNRKESEVSWKVNIDTLIERDFDLDIKNPNKQEEEYEYTSAELLQQLENSFAKSQDIIKQLKA
ncbi:MAG: N-6 DNA methylase [bacterium]